jgi:hypothetical protein
MNVEAITNTIALAIVAIYCLCQMKRMAQALSCESLGYAVLFAFAIGSAAEWYWPAELRAYHVDTGLNVGIALMLAGQHRTALRERFAAALEFLLPRRVTPGELAAIISAAVTPPAPPPARLSAIAGPPKAAAARIRRRSTGPRRRKASASRGRARG